MKTTETTTTFESGNVYFDTAVSNHTTEYKYLMVRRTEKSAWLVDLSDKSKQEKRCKIHTWKGEEMMFPDGQYSMCTVLKPNRIAA